MTSSVDNRRKRSLPPAASKQLELRVPAAVALNDLKKSVGLLQAYGEYKRFLSISKKFMRERGIKLNKKSKKKQKSNFY